MMAKVCGLTDPGDLERTLAAGADLVGFLHHPASPRHCPDLALARRARDRAVLVAAVPDSTALEPLLEACAASWVQPYLPASRRPAALRRLREQGLKVLLPWADEPGQEPLEADLYLWETGAAATGLLGGSGRAHPMAFPPPGPFLLAGGLDGGLLAARLEAMPPAARARCRGFDAASRLESAPGRKDSVLVETFVRRAHALENP